jgi:hypothetical protein
VNQTNSIIAGPSTDCPVPVERHVKRGRLRNTSATSAARSQSVVIRKNQLLNIARCFYTLVSYAIESAETALLSDNGNQVEPQNWVEPYSDGVRDGL